MLKYFAHLCLVLAVLTCVPLWVALALGESWLGPPYALSIGLLLLPELLLWRLPAPNHLQNNEALALLALVYLFSPLALALPFSFSGLSFVDALFETVSALTTTGLSTLATVEDQSPSFLFARAWMQWYGGLGVAIFSLAVLFRRSPASKRLVDAGLELEDLVGSSSAHAQRALATYAALSLAGLLLLWPVLGGYHALLYTLSAVSTGGFAPLDSSLAGFTVWQAGLVLLVSLWGALPLLLYYRAWRQSKPELLWRDLEVRALLLTIGCLSVGLVLSLSRLDHLSLGESAAHALLLTVSAQTGTGFSTMRLDGVNPATLLLLIIAMFIGGGMASTSGGIRILRMLVLARTLVWMVARSCMPSHAVYYPTIGGRRLEEAEIISAGLTVTLFILLIGVSWLAFLLGGYDPMHSLFEVVSATATVGLSTGITSPGLPDPFKLLLCADMLLGRLEIFAFLVLLYPPNWRGLRA